MLSKAMIDRGHELAMGQQTELLRRIDELHLDYPVAGSRMLRATSLARHPRISGTTGKGEPGRPPY